MNIFKQQFNTLCNTTSDINEHLPTLYSYATRCETIFETGVRGVVSSWALAHGLLNNTSSKKYLLLNDIMPCDVASLIESSRNTDLQIECEWKNNLDIQLKHRFDMMFIDTWHSYAQLKRELKKFAKQINKFIIMHDTTIYANRGEPLYVNNVTWPQEEITKGLWPAIEEFLHEHSNEWSILARYINNNGLTILKRINE
jgi:hypothetical protein